MALLKKITFAPLLLLVASFGTSVHADNENYIGLGIGQSMFDFDEVTLTDEEDTAAAIFMGRDINESWSGEFYYHDLGAAGLTETEEVDLSVLGLSAIYHWPNNVDSWSVYGRLGAAHLRNETSPSVDRENAIELGYGLGLRWNMSEKWFSRLEYRGYGEEVSAVFLTAAYKFGTSDSAPAEEVVVEEPAAVEEVVDGDSDADGIADSMDKCPDSAEGAKIDKSGCPVATFEEKKEVLAKIDLRDVNFKSNSQELTADSQASLEAAVVALKANDSIKLEVQAYSDSGGADAYNLALSKKRAASVKQYLMDNGVDASRLTAKGYGEANPIADNSTAAGRAKNRRVEFKVAD
jgi:OOP family OmpA-OmpF porin